MRFWPTFELGYVFPNLNGEMMDGSLERSSRVSSQLVEQIPKISRPTFEIQTELNLRVNSGMFEFMDFASFPDIKFTHRTGEFFIPNLSSNPAFGAIEIGFSHSTREIDLMREIFPINKDKKEWEEYSKRLKEDVLEAYKQIVDAIGVPDYFKYGYGQNTELSKEFVRFIIPRVEAIPVELADFHNKYVAVVKPTEEAHYHKYVKKTLAA